MLRSFFLACFFLLFSSQEAAAQPLEVLYFERPPYYATVNGQPDGFLVSLTRKILAQAGVTASFLEMPARRILTTIKANQGAVCSIGWFSTPERETYATFSLPIYEDQALMAVFLRSGRVPPAGITRFEELSAETDLALGLNEGYSYGNHVDQLISRMRTPPVKSSGPQEQLMRMLAAGRFDFLLVNPIEIDTLARLAEIPPEDILALELSDMPRGNMRHLMFSKAVSSEIIQRVNETIQQMVRLGN